MHVLMREDHALDTALTTAHGVWDGDRLRDPDGGVAGHEPAPGRGH